MWRSRLDLGRAATHGGRTCRVYPEQKLRPWPTAGPPDRAEPVKQLGREDARRNARAGLARCRSIRGRAVGDPLMRDGSATPL